jgi:hypothetical protein
MKEGLWLIDDHNASGRLLVGYVQQRNSLRSSSSDLFKWN